MSKSRLGDAEKSLRWLRGWVSKEAVNDEFQALQRYSHRSQSCAICIRQNERVCTHPGPTFIEKLREFRRKQTLKPFFIVTALFVIAEFSGTTSMAPFNVQIFAAYQSPIAPDRAQAALSLVNNLANVAFLCLIRFTGKRPLYLAMLAMAFLASAVISGYGFAVLPNGTNSFDKIVPRPLEMAGLAYIPFVCILVWNFSSNCGVNSVPWQMLSEVYAFKWVWAFLDNVMLFGFRELLSSLSLIWCLSFRFGIQSAGNCSWHISSNGLFFELPQYKNVF